MGKYKTHRIRITNTKDRSYGTQSSALARLMELRRMGIKCKIEKITRDKKGKTL